MHWIVNLKNIDYALRYELLEYDAVLTLLAGDNLYWQHRIADRLGEPGSDQHNMLITK